MGMCMSGLRSSFQTSFDDNLASCTACKPLLLLRLSLSYLFDTHFTIIMLFTQAWTILALLGVASANTAQPPHIAREQVGAKILAELAARAEKADSPLARQLLGGGDDYAPYSVPCPSDLTWIRPADVGLCTLRGGVRLTCRVSHLGNNLSSSKGNNTSRPSTRCSPLMACLHRLERPFSVWHSQEEVTEP